MYLLNLTIIVFQIDGDNLYTILRSNNKHWTINEKVGVESVASAPSNGDGLVKFALISNSLDPNSRINPTCTVLAFQRRVVPRTLESDVIDKCFHHSTICPMCRIDIKHPVIHVGHLWFRHQETSSKTSNSWTRKLRWELRTVYQERH